MKKLSIPENISLGKEYMPGIGKQELRQLMVAAGPGLLVTAIAWLVATQPGSQLVIMICGMGYIACCYAAVVKIDGAQSMYTYISRIIRFQRSQKRYFYKQGKEVLYYAAKDGNSDADSTGIY